MTRRGCGSPRSAVLPAPLVGKDGVDQGVVPITLDVHVLPEMGLATNARTSASERSVQ